MQKNTLPFLGFSIIAGLISALWGTAFKLGAEWVIHLSSAAYGAVQQVPIWIPLLLIGAAVLGLGASILVSHAQSCKGGGIPTAVAAVRGIVDFPWLQSALILPFSALITFLSGLPLGTEGPCVQMGTAIGDGVTQCLGGKKHRVWRRYIMTGGAAAGFSIATASPITACVFAVEALSGFSNTLPIVIAATVAYLIAELSGVEDFTDAVIEAKERSLRKDAEPETFDTTLSVGKNSFLDGRKLCDILWPNACAVISVEHAHAGHHGEHLQAGDKVTLRYQTYDPAATAEELNALAGEQSPINT